MTKTRRALMSGSVFFLALATGHVMQHGDAIADRFGASQAATAEDGMIEIGAIEDTNAGPHLPTDPVLRDEAQVPTPQRTAPTTPTDLTDRLSEQNARSAFGLPCDVDLSAEPAIGAMMTLEMTAPCYAGASVTVIHQDLRASFLTTAEGRLQVTLPALSPQAALRLRFEDGVEITAEVNVPEAADFDRVALMWQGDALLGLHAYEYGAKPGQSGHIHVGQPYVASRAANLGRGFLTRLGEGGADNWRAEVFSFPTAQARRTGAVTLSVTAQPTASHCGAQLPARLVTHHRGAAERPATDVLLTLPDCGGTQDILVLKNLVAPLKVAGN